MSAAHRSGSPEPDSAGPALPRAGDVLHVTREASVQFATPIYFRVIRVHDWPTYTGWLWLDGYQLNAAGDAVERRSIFVQANGLRRVHEPPSVQRAPRAGTGTGTGTGTGGPAVRSRRPQPN